MKEVVVVGNQTVRKAARPAASQVQAKYRRERVERDRRLERLAVEGLTALGLDIAIAMASGGLTTPEPMSCAWSPGLTPDSVPGWLMGTFTVGCRSLRRQASHGGTLSPLPKRPVYLG